MAIKTSELWQTLIRKKGTRKEFKFEIDGKTYGEESEIRHTVETSMFETLSIGQAASAKLTLELIADTIPRGAEIKRFVRLVNGGEVSEWIPYGIFYTSLRTLNNGVWKIEAYDVMRKAEQPFIPAPEMNFPIPMDEAAELFAKTLGTELDPRCNLNHNYSIDYPATGTIEQTEAGKKYSDNYSIRNELQWIAAAHGGNWIVTYEGKLLLVPLGSEPEETNILVCEHGDAIQFGGCVILVR